MAAAGAPEVPVLAYLAVGLLSLLAWIVLRGLAAAYRSSLGWMLEKLADVLDFHVRWVHVDLGGPVRALDNAFLHVLTGSAAKAEQGVGYFFHGAAVIQEWATRQLLHLATETFAWAHWLQTVHLPRWLKWAISIAVPPILIARLVRAAIHAELPRLTKLIHAGAHAATVVITKEIPIAQIHEIQWLHRHWKAIAAAIAASSAGAVAGHFPWVHVFPRLRHLEREGLHVRKRLHRLERLLAAGGLAVAMANVLGLPNWRCLTRGNVGRTARVLCGIPAHLLEDLLGLVADFIIIADICEVVGWLEEGLKVIEPELTALVVAADMALCHGDYDPPPHFTLAPLQETPLQTTLDLAA